MENAENPQNPENAENPENSVSENTEQVEKDPILLETSEKNLEECELSDVNVSWAKSQDIIENQEPTKTEASYMEVKKSYIKEKPKEEKSSEKHVVVLPKDGRKNAHNAVLKAKPPLVRKNDRDFRRYKAKYNSSFGKIMREWMSLIYCILILRMNLMKFILERISDSAQNNFRLQKQIILESKVIYKMIRDAQHYSQKKFLLMWLELEKLISSRMALKNALETIQMKDLGLRDWRTASTKLTQLQDEFRKAQTAYKIIQRSKNESENALKENVSKLESLSHSKSVEYEQLVEQITIMKKKEAQMRGKILLNMKSYKDLKSKRQHLLNVVTEMNQFKSDQNILIQEYSSKIQSLKSQIEEKEKQINVEKEEKKKIKAKLENFGDFSRKSISSFPEG